MYIIKAQVNQFNYYLRFDKYGKEFIEGLKDNADQFTKKQVEQRIANLKSIWPLTAEKFPKSDKSLVDLS